LSFEDRSAAMKKFGLAIVLTLALVGITMAERYQAIIIGANADKGTVEYRRRYLKDFKEPVMANVTKDCAIREGKVILGKPLRIEEGEPIINGLGNFIFQNANAANPLHVNIFTADADDKDKGIRKGDVVKILVPPSR